MFLGGIGILKRGQKKKSCKMDAEFVLFQRIQKKTKKCERNDCETLKKGV